jgi:RimJ/RimL family protein N-acetyltransferase
MGSKPAARDRNQAIVKLSPSPMTLLNSTEVLKTERLILRRLERVDLDYFIDIHGDPDVARYIGAGNPRSKSETEQWFHDIEDSYKNANLGQLMVLRKSDGARIGRCGLSDAVLESQEPSGRLRKGWFFSAHAPSGTDVNHLPELGYTFGKSHWGQGYATEAARAVYQYALSHLSYATIMSVIHADNKGSRAVVAKFDVRYIDLVELAGRPFERYHWPMSLKR